MRTVHSTTFAGCNMRKNYYVFNDGELKREDNTIYLRTKDGEKKPLPVKKVGALHLLGQLDFNTRFFSFLSEEEVPAHYYNWFDHYAGSYYPQEFLNSGKVLVNQALHYDDRENRLQISREIVKGASHNMVENLRYYARKGKQVEEAIKEIEHFRSSIENTKTPNELLGVEGKMRDIYYGEFSEILREGFTLEKRTKQPPGNEVNAMISFGNSMLYTTTLNEIYRTHLNPTISYLHEPRERRYSLSLDLSEIFKPVLVDRTIFKVVNKQLIKPDDFRDKMGGCLLTESGKKTFVREYEDRLERTVEHESLGRNVSYQRLLRLEGYKLVKHISGDDRYESYRCTR